MPSQDLFHILNLLSTLPKHVMNCLKASGGQVPGETYTCTRERTHTKMQTFWLAKLRNTSEIMEGISG